MLRLLTGIIPFRWLVRTLGDPLENRAACMLVTPEQRRKARQIGKMMHLVGRSVPWQCKCMAEAVCVKFLLNLYGIPSVAYLGAYMDSDDPNGMKAHAWVTCGALTVIGGPVHRRYTVTAVFTTPALA